MLEKNTKQINQAIANMFAWCTIAVAFLVICSCFGIFEFGRTYTGIILGAGLVLTVSPKLLLPVLPDHIMKYYMLIGLAIFIGALGTNQHIGIYISYALVPIFSCLYFDPKLVVRSSVLSYVIMGISVYINSATKYEVVDFGMPRMKIFIAYMLGFTVEYVIVVMVLRYLVMRAKKLMEKQHSAEEENRMKTRFLSSMSHEIRTPMNAIIGMTDVALRQNPDQNTTKCLKVIQSSSTGLLEIINDILDLSKIEAGKLTIICDTYDVGQMIQDVEAIVDARNTNEQVVIDYHVPTEYPPYLYGDVVRIKQVMINYASNAIKYTEQGRIDITFSFAEQADGGFCFTYSVQDTGQGIREQDMGRLFEMYSQIDLERNHYKEGTGIGLAICKNIMEQMDGTIFVESTYGRGSTFSFAVNQRAAAKPEGKKVTYRDTFSYYTRDTRVLLVDDNAMNREVFKAILEPLQLQFEEAENGKKALEMIAQHSYDLVFMDSHMPVMDGEEATKAIRALKDENKRRIPIIAITADAVSGVREHLLSIGMDDYIEKPIDPKVMSQKIYSYLPKEKVIERNA